MTADELRLLSSLLDEGMALPVTERESWLRSLGAEAAPLATTLRELLAKQASQDTADLIHQSHPARAPGPGAGDAVGPYRLLQELGHGGMGAVWLAERVDGHPRRKVALKLPFLGWAPGLAERFVRESQILASLEHPRIARLYDAGVDDRGRPYMALEYVEGEGLDAFCRNRSLPLKARLELLLQVAEAVAFAHSRLVVHRDLKPSNILVTADGQVRLLDFGVAKLLEGERAIETRLTQLGGRALTPDYASPEQILGAPIGTASDVYSLGVVAYELLAGRRPYVLKRGSGAELEEAITAVDPPLASEAASDAATKRELRGDLDAILNKALKKDPLQRYATVEELAQDWRRFLRHEPVLARPDTLAYRAGRFARRHRVTIAAAAIAIFALASGLVAALWQASRAATERDRAFALAERNAAGNRFLDTLLLRASRGGPLSALQLIERAERLVGTELRDNDEHRAYVLGLVGNLYANIEEAPKALAVFERALEAARRGSDPHLVHRLESRRAAALGGVGRFEEASALLDAILARPDLEPELRSEIHGWRALHASRDGNGAAALKHATEGLRWYRAARRPPRHLEPSLLNELAWANHMNGRFAEAEARYADAAARFAALGLGDTVPALGSARDRAMMYQELGDLAGSIRLYESVRDAWTRADPAAPPSSNIIANLAYALAHAGRFEEALAGYRESEAVARSQGDKVVAYNIRMLIVELEVMRGRPSEARREFEAAERERDFEPPAGGAAQWARLCAQAYLALAEGRPAAAIEVLKGESLGKASAGAITMLLVRASAHLLAGDLQAADADARIALENARKLQGSRASSFRTGLALLTLARMGARSGRAAEARQLAREALDQLTPQLDGRHPALEEARHLASSTL